MNKTAKSLIGVLLVLLLAASFVACGGGKKDDGIIELTVLNYMDLSNPGSINEMNDVWERFEKANPDIRIVREDLFDEPFHQKTEAYAAAGQIPDVIQCWPSGRSTTLHTQRLLKDLAPFVARDGLASQYTPVSLDPSQQAAGYLGMITRGMTATNAVFVNMEVLNDCGLQPAKTYSELIAQMPILRAKGYDTLVMSTNQTWVMQSCLFSAIAGRFCGEGWDQRIHSGQAKFTDPDFVAALEFVKRMYDDGLLTQAMFAIDYTAAPADLANNKAAYLIDGDWQTGAFISTGMDLLTPEQQKKLFVTVFPEIDIPGVKIPARTNTVVLATGWGMNANIPAGSAKEEAAWRLVKWLVGKECVSFFLENGTFAAGSRTDIDASTLKLEPAQVATSKLGGEYDVSTVVIDAAFEGPVYTPLNDGLAAIGMGTMTPQQVASVTQAAFDNWKASQ